MSITNMNSIYILYFFNSGMSAIEFTRDTNWRNNSSWLSKVIVTAFSGQTSAHLPHPLQSPVIDAFPFFISMAFTKQVLRHISQPLHILASTENERPGRRLYALSRFGPRFFMWVRYIQLVSSQKQINIRSRKVVQKDTGSIQTCATLAFNPAAEAHSMWASASEVETFRRETDESFV